MAVYVPLLDANVHYEWGRYHLTSFWSAEVAHAIVCRWHELLADCLHASLCTAVHSEPVVTYHGSNLFRCANSRIPMGVRIASKSTRASELPKAAREVRLLRKDTARRLFILTKNAQEAYMSEHARPNLMR
jgi:hypothetical protein